MESLEFIDENGEKTQFYVIEETRINGINYLLVSESADDEEAEAYILKDTSDAASEEAVGKVFSELMDDDVELK